MWGISWGGFNALQVAALHPPELKAIVSVCSTDNRYLGDVHYFGGTLLCEQLCWGSVMLTEPNFFPPDPHFVSDWKEQWLKRLNETPFYVEDWYSHQNYDDFYKQGSVCENYEGIKCPTFLVGGWGDPYATSIPRMMKNLKGRRRSVIGPWGHKYPHIAYPNPRMDFIK